MKKGLRIHHLHQIFKKKKNRGNPELPTLLREDKNSLFGFIWSYKAEVLILPHHVHQSFEGKNYTQFWRRNQHESQAANAGQLSFPLLATTLHIRKGLTPAILDCADKFWT